MTARIVELRQGILEKNDLLAESLRRRFVESGVRVSNWVSSPGTGKTALLEALLGQAVRDGLRRLRWWVTAPQTTMPSAWRAAEHP